MTDIKEAVRQKIQPSCPTCGLLLRDTGIGRRKPKITSNLFTPTRRPGSCPKQQFSPLRLSAIRPPWPS